MAIKGYLEIPDINGESVLAGHENQIEIHGMSWEVTRTASKLASRVRRRSTLDATVLSVVKFIDRSSPYLALATMQGRSFDEIVLHIRKDSGSEAIEYLTITMTNCIVASYRMENEGVVTPETQIGETMSIDFEKVRTVYTETDAGLSSGVEHEIEFDIAAAA